MKTQKVLTYSSRQGVYANTISEKIYNIIETTHLLNQVSQEDAKHQAVLSIQKIIEKEKVKSYNDGAMTTLKEQL